MNRPQKQTKETENVVDERNLVNVDEAFQEADLDDRLWLWWEQNRKSIIVGVGILVLGTAGIETYKLMQKSALNGMQSEYANLPSLPSQLESFGMDHQKQPLGGVALTEAADTRFEESAFLEAAKLYEQANNPLGGTTAQPRVRIGQAMSFYKEGSLDKAKALLSQIADDAQVLPSFRGEAAYRLALIALEDTDYSTADLWLSKVDSVDTSQVWKTQADYIRRNVPELAKAEPAAGFGDS